MTSNDNPQLERATYTVKEAIQLSGFGRTAFYEAIRRGEVPHVRIGDSIRIHREAFHRWLQGQRKAATE